MRERIVGWLVGWLGLGLGLGYIGLGLRWWTLGGLDLNGGSDLGLSGILVRA